MDIVESERAQIRDCLDQLWAALRQGDPRAIAELYHPNANLVLRGEEVAVGRQDIERQYAELLALDPVRPDTMVTSSLRIHLVRPDVAIVDAASRLTRVDASGAPQKLGDVFFTIVAVKDEQGWRLAAVRGADPSNLSPP
jgi:uncharacterized protein (TIGR02246 family)